MRSAPKQPDRHRREVTARREHSSQRWGGQKPIITGPLGEAKERNTLADKLAAKPKRAA